MGKNDLIAIGNSMLTASIAPPPPTKITFQLKDGEELLRLEENGDIYVKGNLAENDKEVVWALRMFLIGHNYL